MQQYSQTKPAKEAGVETNQLQALIERLVGYCKISPYHADAMYKSFGRAVETGQFTEEQVIQHLMDEYGLQPGD